MNPIKRIALAATLALATLVGAAGFAAGPASAATNNTKCFYTPTYQNFTHNAAGAVAHGVTESVTFCTDGTHVVSLTNTHSQQHSSPWAFSQWHNFTSWGGAGQPIWGYTVEGHFVTCTATTCSYYTNQIEIVAYANGTHTVSHQSFPSAW